MSPISSAGSTRLSAALPLVASLLIHAGAVAVGALVATSHATPPPILAVDFFPDEPPVASVPPASPAPRSRPVVPPRPVARPEAPVPAAAPAALSPPPVAPAVPEPEPAAAPPTIAEEPAGNAVAGTATGDVTKPVAGGGVRAEGADGTDGPPAAGGGPGRGGAGFAVTGTGAAVAGGGSDGLTSLARPRGGYQTRPAYPDAARRAGIEGVTVLRFQVLEDGRVGAVAVERSAGFAELDRAAVTAVRTWLFEPARRGHQAVAVWVTLPVRFELRGR